MGLVARVESWGATEKGPVRESNQDAFACLPERGLFVVADGMGGHADGDVAARMAAEGLPRALPRNTEPSPEALADAFRSVHHEILQAGRRRASGGRAPMGTTAVALWLGRGRACWAHVGDSRLYRLRGGALELLTADDTAFGRALPPGARVPLDLPHTNRLAAALGGIDPDVEPHAAGADTRPGDAYLLCSDGLSGPVPPEEIGAELAAARPVAAAGAALLGRALARGGSDNVTLILARLGDEQGAGEPSPERLSRCS